MDFDVIIPARYASTRLPGKPLIEIGGKPLIQWVCECAAESAASRVLVATDDIRIRDVVEGFGGEAYLTSTDHPSGSDRIAELVRELRMPESRVIVNVQGDEPRMPGKLIDQVAQILIEDNSAQVSTVCHKIESLEEFTGPHVVKVVRDLNRRALYFSRAPIPWTRDAATGEWAAFRHIGIYGFRVGFLEKFTSWPVSTLERTERLEQLRIMENGAAITVCEAETMPGPGIDTPADLESFSQWVNHHG